MQRKMQEMLKRRVFRLSDIEYGVYVVYTGCCTLEACTLERGCCVYWKGTYGDVKTCALL